MCTSLRCVYLEIFGYVIISIIDLLIGENKKDQILNNENINNYKITLAVAGFSEDELNIILEERQLIISGKQIEKANQNTFIYRGIAARHFQKTFVLADGVEVSGASLENGLLNVFLLRKNLQPKVKTIKINSNN